MGIIFLDCDSFLKYPYIPTLGMNRGFSSGGALFIRFLAILAGLLLFSGGVASALEPVRSGVSMNEMMSGLRPAQIAVPQAARRHAPVDEKKVLAKPRSANPAHAVKPKALIAMPPRKDN